MRIDVVTKRQKDSEVASTELGKYLKNEVNIRTKKIASESTRNCSTTLKNPSTFPKTTHRVWGETSQKKDAVLNPRRCQNNQIAPNSVIDQVNKCLVQILLINNLQNIIRQWSMELPVTANPQSISLKLQVKGHEVRKKAEIL